MVSIGSIVIQGAILGAVATVAMNVVMDRLPEGRTPTLVAASVLTGVAPDAVTARRASGVHYAAGLASGVGFLSLLAASWQLLGVDSAAPLTVRGIVGLGVSASVLYGFLLAFFTVLVLPRHERGFARQRLRAIRTHWAISAATHVGSLVVLWVLLVTVV